MLGMRDPLGYYVVVLVVGVLLGAFGPSIVASVFSPPGQTPAAVTAAGESSPEEQQAEMDLVMRAELELQRLAARRSVPLTPEQWERARDKLIAQMRHSR